MDASSRYPAAGGHLVSALVGLVATAIGARWVNAGGEPVAIPATLVILSLLVLTPIAVRRSWHSRGEFLDKQAKAASRFLTGIGVSAVLVIGLPVLVAWRLPSGTEAWSSLLVLPYLGAIALPVTWVFFAIRAAILTLKGVDEPFPRRTEIAALASLR